MKDKVFVKTGKVDEQGNPYVKLVSFKDSKFFNEDDVLDWVKLWVLFVMLLTKNSSRWRIMLKQQ